MAKKKKLRHLRIVRDEERVPQFIKMKMQLIFKPTMKIIFEQIINVEDTMIPKNIVSRFISQFDCRYEEVVPSSRLLVPKGSSFVPYIHPPKEN